MVRSKNIEGHSTEENFLAYYNYGNHSTADVNPDAMKEVMIKHSKRGNTILIDLRLIPFILHLQLTPQGLVDLDNKWKDTRPIYNSTFRPTVMTYGINDWTNKKKKKTKSDSLDHSKHF